MRKLFFASLIIFAVSCKKETPEPTPVNPSNPPSTANVSILNGDGHNNDTVTWTINQQAHFHVNGSYLAVSANSDSFIYDILLRVPATTTGQYQCLSSSQVTFGSTNYTFASATVNVVKYEAVGGTINCNYSGTFKKQSDTTVVITVIGNFNVIRGSDL